MKKRYLFFSLLLFSMFILFIGPWPTDDKHFSETNYAADTFTTVEKIVPLIVSGQLQAGVASIDITPPVGVPLAGYSAREPKANQGMLARIFAKAITINNGQQQVTLLSAEILLPLAELVESVLEKANIKRSQLYFTSTHTHSGPGGYANGLVESIALGDFDDSYFQFLSDQLAKVVTASKSKLQNVSLNYQRFQFKTELQQQYIFNQLTDGPNAHDSTHVLQLIAHATQKPIATLVTFSAHPTFLGRVNKKISGDYPTILVQKLKEHLDGEILFMSGGVGGMLPIGENSKPKKELEIEIRQMNDLGNRLANTIATALQNATEDNDFDAQKTQSWQTEKAVIQAEIIPIKLPAANYRMSDSLRLSPYLIKMAFHDSNSYLHAVKIGKLKLFAYPADFSGELAQELEQWASTQDNLPITHSFNGDYLGYIMPSNRYDIDHYITRDTNFYGRWAGDYMIEVSKKFIQQVN